MTIIKNEIIVIMVIKTTNLFLVFIFLKFNLNLKNINAAPINPIAIKLALEFDK